MQEDIVFNVEGDPSELEGKTFQIHVLPGNRIRLYHVTLVVPDTQCQAIIKGERCGRKAGHEGKHRWANGD